MGAFWLTLVLIGLLVVPTNAVLAGFNQQINYQGKLTDSSNVAVSDGSRSIVFSLYTASSGGVAIWTETQSVTSTSGLFSVMLGSVSALDDSIFNQTLYLGVKVGSDAEMTPRKTIGAVPAAFEAQRLGGLASTSLLRSDATNATGTITNLNFTMATGSALYLSGAITGATWTGSTIAATYGGTGLSAYSAGDLIFATTTSVLDRLAIGSAGQVLKVVAGKLTWDTDQTGSGAAGLWASTTDSLALYPSSVGYVLLVGASATSTIGNIMEVKGNALFQNTLTAYDTISAPIFSATSTTGTSLFSGQISVTGTSTFATTTSASSTISIAHIVNLNADLATFTAATSTSLYSQVLSALTAIFTNLTATNASSTNLYVADQTILAGAGGKVGVGTTTPNAVLSVNALNSTDNLFQVASSTNQNIFLINSNGNVGIGVASPTTKLQVNGDINSTGTFYAGTSASIVGNFTAYGDAGANGGKLNLQYGATRNGTYQHWVIQPGNEASSDRFWLGTNLSNSLFMFNGAGDFLLNSTGKLGVGSTTPFATLSVNGSAGVPNFVVGSSTGTYLIVDKNGNTGLGQQPTTGYRLSVSGHSFLNGDVDVGSILTAPDAIFTYGTSTYATSTVLNISSLASTSALIVSNGTTLNTATIRTLTLTNALTIANGGTGTTTFNAGGVVFSDGTKLTQNTANFYWDNTNKWLGIGTSSPLAKLEVVSASGGAASGLKLTQAAQNGSAASSYIPIDFSVPTTGLIGQFLVTAPNYSNAGVNLESNSVALFAEAPAGQLALAAGGSSGYMTFNTGGYAAANERMRITSTGNVGIGTTTPNYKLTVNTGGLSVEDSTTNFGGFTMSSNARIGTFSGLPSGTTLSTASLVVNPAGTGDVNRLLFGAGVAGVSRFTVDVEGDTYALGSLSVGSTLSAGSSTLTNLSVTNNSVSTFAGGLTVNSNTLVVDAINNSVGIATSSYSAAKLSVGGTQNTGGGAGGTGELLAIDGLLNFNSSADTGSALMIKPTVANVGSANILYGLEVDFKSITSNTSQISKFAGIRVAEETTNTFGTSSIGFLYGNHPGGTTDYGLYLNSGDTNYLGTGNIGIGTTTPAVGLSIQGADSYGLLHLVGSTANSASTIQFKSADDSDTLSWVVGKNITVTNDNFSIWYNNANRLLIDSSGNVGIGTNTPDSLLQVGNATSYFKINSGNATTTGYLTVGTAPASANFTAGNLNVQNNGVFGGTVSSTALFITGNATTTGTLSVRSVPYSWPSTQGGVSTILQNNGSGVLTWAAAGGATPAGSNGQIQYNSGGSFTATSSLYWDETNKILQIATTSWSIYGRGGGYLFTKFINGNDPISTLGQPTTYLTATTTYISTGIGLALAAGTAGADTYLSVGGNGGQFISPQIGGNAGNVYIAVGGSGYDSSVTAGNGGTVTLAAAGSTGSSGTDGTVTIGSTLGRNATFQVWGNASTSGNLIVNAGRINSPSLITNGSAVATYLASGYSGFISSAGGAGAAVYLGIGGNGGSSSGNGGAGATTTISIGGNDQGGANTGGAAGGLILAAGGSGGTYGNDGTVQIGNRDATAKHNAAVNIYGVLQVNYGSICVDTNTCTASSSAAGSMSAVRYNTGASDLAENYTSYLPLEAGDIVAPSGGETVIKASAGQTLLGIVSTKPGVLLGNSNELNQYPIALSGRVPVKVNAEGGDISVGDHLTISSQSGVAKKTTANSNLIGIALENYSGAGVGKILAFVTLTPGSLETSANELSSMSTFDFISRWNYQAADFLASTTEAVATLSNRILTGLKVVKDLFAERVIAAVGLFDQIKTRWLETDTMRINSGLEIKDAVSGEIYCVKIVTGDWSKTKGSCQNNSVGPEPTSTSTPPIISTNPIETTGSSTTTGGGSIATSTPPVENQPVSPPVDNSTLSSSPVEPTPPIITPAPIPSPLVEPTPEPALSTPPPPAEPPPAPASP